MAELMLAVEKMAATLPDLVVGTWHGDWTAWNMARTGTHLQLWDFERFERGVVHGLDGFHYLVNEATLKKGQSVDVIYGSVRDAAALMGGGRIIKLVGAVYLSAIAERYLASSSSGLGHLIQERAANVVNALRRWLPEIADAD